MVWEETASVYQEMIREEGWDALSIIPIPAVKVYTNKVSRVA